MSFTVFAGMLVLTCLLKILFVCLDGVPGNLQVDAGAAPSRCVPSADSGTAPSVRLICCSRCRRVWLHLQWCLSLIGCLSCPRAWLCQAFLVVVLVLGVELALVLPRLDRRAAASWRDLLALCDSGAQHSSGVEGAPSPFCAGLDEAGIRDLSCVIQIVVFDSFLSSRCVDSRRSCCVEFARVSHCTNSCLGTHAARANSRGLHNARRNSGGH